jgi:hypothetical protein
MKSKLLPVLLVVLILLNGVLIFMLIKKPLQNKRLGPERNFLSVQLQFSEEQEAKFLDLDEIHKEKMEKLSHQIRVQKDLLFNSFSNDEVNIDSLVNVAGKLEIEKELEVFTFFRSVRKICSATQKNKFDEIISKAIKGGKPGALPKGGGDRPPRDRGMPPPPR